MSETNSKDQARTDQRQPWQDLRYDKIAAADAEIGGTFPGVDGPGTYS